jgi:hypothetical protein
VLRRRPTTSRRVYGVILPTRTRAEDAGGRSRRAAQHRLARCPVGPGYNYITEHTCDPLALLAAPFPDRMLSLVMTEVKRMANDPLPLAQRPARIAMIHLVEEWEIGDKT